MAVREDQDRAARPHATFELERFDWAAPDRLEVSGRFVGLGDVPASQPRLAVRGPERVHHLHPPPDTPALTLEDAAPWAAQFVWQEPPVAFEAATLEFDGDIVVELPPPGTRRRKIRGVRLAVRTAADAATSEADTVEWQEPTPARRVEQVGLEAQLLAAREELRELRATAERMQEELSRARDDLNRERERHAGDAERFREGLEHVRKSATDAVATEHAALEKAKSALRETRTAMQARDAELQELRRRLEEQAANHVAGLGEVRRTTDDACAGAEELLKRLQAIRASLGDGG